MRPVTVAVLLMSGLFLFVPLSVFDVKLTAKLNDKVHRAADLMQKKFISIIFSNNITLENAP